MKNSLLIVLLSLSLLLANTRTGYCLQAKPSTLPQSAASLDANVEKIKKNVQKLGIGHQVTAILKSGKEYHGTISNIEAESFQVAEVDLKQVVTIRYDETKKVYKNYYHKDLIFGRNPHKQRFVLIAILTFIVVGMAVGLKHLGQ